MNDYLSPKPFVWSKSGKQVICLKIIDMSSTQAVNTTSQAKNEDESKVIKSLEIDDEFEDFPEDSKWNDQPNPQLNPTTLWEEDWDDAEAEDEFTAKLREELAKAQKSA